MRNKIDSDTVIHMARLARLRLDAGQVEVQKAHFGRLLELVSIIQQVDTKGVAPLSHPLEPDEAPRADRCEPVDRREALLALAPHSDEELYLVPRVIE